MYRTPSTLHVALRVRHSATPAGLVQKYPDFVRKSTVQFVASSFEDDVYVTACRPDAFPA